MPDACRSCAGPRLEPFHEVDAVPVHDTVVLATRAEALAFPTGRLRLALCEDCGLVQNTAFDEALLDYAHDYEESQAFSPRFQRFTDELVSSLVSTYRLEGAFSLEVGCGKGDFLADLCRATGGPGLGFDPAYVRRGGADGAVEVRPRRFEDADTGLRPDAVVCRHTLEHVPDVLGLVRRLRATAAHRSALVYLEVPDVLRVLREAAFWDVYYEHCSYFSTGSLADLAGRGGLAVARVSLVFDGQYVALEARPGPVLPPDDRHVAELVEAVSGFRRAVGDLVERWRAVLAEHEARGDAVVVWGASSKAVGFLTTVGAAGPGGPVRNLVDVNPHKAGRYLPGLSQQVVAPADLAADPPALVVAMNAVYRDEIAADLDRLGVRTQLTCL